MTPDAVLMLVLSGILGGLIGGGAIAGLFYRALKDRLRKDLKDDFASVAFESVALMAKETADTNSDRVTRLEESGGAHSIALSRTLVRIDHRLDEMDNRQRQAQREIDRTVALLDALEKRMDRHAHGGD